MKFVSLLYKQFLFREYLSGLILRWLVVFVGSGEARQLIHDRVQV